MSEPVGQGPKMDDETMRARRKTNLRTIKIFGAIVAVLIVGSCVAALAGGEGDEPLATVAQAPTPSATAAPTSEAPAPKATAAPNEAPSNPLDTSDNDTACSNARREVAKRSQIFADVSRGVALPEDAATAAGELQEELGDTGSFASGSIQTDLLALSDAYGRMRVSLATGDVAALEAAVGQSNVRLESLDTACTSIGS